MACLRKFLQLAVHEQRFYLKTFLLVGTIRLGLWLLPFNLLRRVLRHAGPTIAAARDNDGGLNRIARAVAAVSRLVPKANCLTQALATQLLLRRRGYQADLHIGVAKNEHGRLQAHAWLENQGNVIIGQLADLPRFSSMPPLTGL